MKDKEYEVIECEGIECYAPKDIAELLKVSRAEAYRLFKSKGFPSFTLGERSKRVTKRDFVEWLEMQKNKTA